jgi:hypothetical protein
MEWPIRPADGVIPNSAPTGLDYRPETFCPNPLERPSKAEDDSAMDVQVLKDQVRSIVAKRDYLLSLLDRADLGPIRIDVNQALEELDDLIAEYEEAFPGEAIPQV